MENKTNDTTVKDIRNLFKLKKESKAIKNRVIIDIRNFFDHEDENYYKPVKIDNFWSRNHIDYESNSEKNKTLSIAEYLN